ncbi:MAG: 50S ribosomal protein P1 [Candidatus Bathyarchaeia archaeon]|nr:50S ribosomal protein P1 [Candidatus Bathyarchaeota archaeon]
MKYVYAALLLHAAKKPITEENMKKVLSAAEIEIDEARVKSLVASLAEINIDEAIKSSTSLIAQPAASASQPTEKAEKKEEKPKKEEKKEEEALAGLGALFG